MRELSPGTRRSILAALAAIAVVTATPLLAQSTAAEVVGVVRDVVGKAVPRADVFIAAVGRRATTDAEGRFALRAVPAGRQLLQAALLGYAPVRREVTVGEGMAPLSIVLPRTPLSIPGVQVTATVGGKDPLTVTQAT